LGLIDGHNIEAQPGTLPGIVLTSLDWLVNVARRNSMAVNDGLGLLRD
jgi:hypothetical protein